ncbi:MAG: hypothetical protein AUK63_2699 [bacterium P3]|nr:MAG: hypothetical protein AUK63_2699 [bacterium P3]
MVKFAFQAYLIYTVIHLMIVLGLTGCRPGSYPEVVVMLVLILYAPINTLFLLLLYYTKLCQGILTSWWKTAIESLMYIAIYYALMFFLPQDIDNIVFNNELFRLLSPCIIIFGFWRLYQLISDHNFQNHESGCNKR